MIYTKAQKEIIGKLALENAENYNAIAALGDSMYRRGVLLCAAEVFACVGSAVVGWCLRCGFSNNTKKQKIES